MATTYTARFWDKASPINGCPAEKAMTSFGLTENQKLGILSADGRDCITKIFDASATDADLTAWLDEQNKQAAAQEQAAQQKQQQSQTLEQQITALQIATDTQPIDTSTLAGAQKAKIRELSNDCHAAIYAGADAATSKGTEHFSLTDNDQINLSNLMEQVKGGAAQVPYHSDGQLCRMFTAAEMTAVYQAAVQYIAYNTTLCNHLLTWVRRCTAVADVNAITYTSVLPDDLQQNLNTILGGAKS